MYTERSEQGFITDLYWAQVNGAPDAQARIAKHQQHELEKRAITSATLGGIIPPAYLVDLYAKAARNGRVFADQCNRTPLPDVGMVRRVNTTLSSSVAVTASIVKAITHRMRRVRRPG